MINRKGFTLVELMISMTFVSVLLIAVATLTIHITGIYTRGISIQQVNTAGQELANSLQRSVQASQAIDTDSSYIVFMNNDTATDRVLRGKEAYDAMSDPVISEKVMGGRLCLQDRAYVWNTGTYLLDTSVGDSPNVINGTDTPIHLARVQSASLCGNADDDSISDFDKIEADKSDELLKTGDRDLAIHRMLVGGNNSTGLYSISFTIGTNRLGTIDKGSDSCKPPADSQADEEYCAVNRFDFVVRTVQNNTDEEAL